MGDFSIKTEPRTYRTFNLSQKPNLEPTKPPKTEPRTEAGSTQH